MKKCYRGCSFRVMSVRCIMTNYIKVYSIFQRKEKEVGLRIILRGSNEK
jgi:hypothetical protein